MSVLIDEHDSELRRRVDAGGPDAGDAAALLAQRTEAATAIRVALARAYGRDGMSTARAWHVLPYLTPDGTLGVVDIAAGTAWDLRTPAPATVEALGVQPPGEAYAAASMAPGASGTVRFDGEAVQAQGTAVVDGQMVPPTAPAGWRQIDLPTWRASEVPVALYRPPRVADLDGWGNEVGSRWEVWRPTLTAAGLTTCYGRPGDEAAGEHLGRAHGWEASWPHGLPPWVGGTSVTVLDVIADGARDHREGYRYSLPRTHEPRGSDYDELDRVRPLVDLWRADTVVQALRVGADRELVAAVALDRTPAAAGALASHLHDLELAEQQARAEWTLSGRQGTPPPFYPRHDGHAGNLARGLSDAEQALADSEPWLAARALSRGSYAIRLFGPIWPRA